MRERIVPRVTGNSILRARASLKHYRILNGTHWVLLCDPSTLATEHNSVPDRSVLTCPTCFEALSDDDARTIQREAFKRMNDIGKPRR